MWLSPMPPSKDSLTKCLLVSQLPVLDFLAPRVFRPWPEPLLPRRAHGTSSTTGSPDYRLKVENLRHSNTRYGIGISNNEFRRTNRPRNVEFTDNRPSRFRTGGTNKKHDGMLADKERFQRAYEDTWGSNLAKRRFTDQFSFPSKDVCELASLERDERAQYVPEKEKKPRSTKAAVGGSLPAQPITLPYDVQEKGRLYRRALTMARIKIPYVRTKFIRLTRRKTTHTPLHDSKLESFSTEWSYFFTQLCRKYESDLNRVKFPRPLRFRAMSSTRSFERALSHSSIQEIQQAWQALPYTKRELMWNQVMLGSLGRKPSWALKFLIATANSEPHPPSYALSDTLEYIVCFFLYKAKDPDVGDVTVLFRAVMGLFDKFDHNYLHLSQKTLFWLLSYVSIDQAELLYKTLLRRNHPIHENTLLQFARTFARKGRTQLAIDALRSFHSSGGDFTQRNVESVCAAILQRKYRDPSIVVSDSSIFSLLLDLGLRPNIIIYNILLQNAAESGDSETAWKIHDMMPGLGIEADAHTYSLLLNDAKLRMDQPAMERIARIIESRGISNDYIITDLLHAMFLISEQERRESKMHAPPSAPLKRMLPLYAEFFDIEPIRGLLTQKYRNLLTLATPSDRTKMHPSKGALVVMLIALLRGFTNPTSAPEWYHRFRTMVLSGHPDIAPLAETTRIYDAVIMCLGRWPVTLPLCTRVISDMFSSYSAAQKAQQRLHLPIRNGKPLQTVMGSYSAFASTSLPNLRGLMRKKSENRTDQEFNGLSEERAAAEFGEKGDTIDEYPLKGSKPIKPFPVPPKVVTEVSEPSTNEAIIFGHCKPTVYTWSILLKAFMDHKQPRAAEQVLTMMQRRGVTPNQVTWNSLAVGYARLQDIANTVDVIERFENEGWEVNDGTMKALQVIENRKALMETLGEKDRRRIEKQKIVQAAVERQLASSGSGSLHAVVHEEKLFGHYENWLVDSSDTLTRAHRRYRRPKRLRIHEDDIDFLEKSIPKRRA